ncbi:hypothetical protein [Marinimicrobium sp. C2-29]|uniref:hypothetical protein n=1 Tax=Marinimicrobium sp. C2-29 TaxID=3139825 RepID=UPI00313A37CB
MNKLTSIVAVCVLGLMASAVQADEMASGEGMMDDDMKASANNQDMKKGGMSDSMNHDMKDDDMSREGMGMKADEMASEKGMIEDDMKKDDMSDSMD